MAKKILYEDITEHSFLPNDEHGFRLTLRREEYEENDIEGNKIEANSIEAGDGSTFGLNQLNQGLILKRCDICSKQKKPIMPFSPSTSVKSCFYCRRNLCSRHHFIYENHIVCKKCMFIQKYLKPLFFKKES
jgi:hypothetical protein